MDADRRRGILARHAEGQSVRETAAAAKASVVVGLILLWPASPSAPAEPTSEQIKASAQACLDDSLRAGRTAAESIRAVGKTPGS
ncbi:hypothetical protein [Streptomyces sp. NPDC000618]|uniref:hypothetical protein n=1 Tax=Streptomyces sp. NPDC000618 TaxID=3154265 RepID=UPI00331FE829